MRLKLLAIFILCAFFTGSYAQCGPGVPGFTVNLTGSPDSTWTSPFVVRNGNCCGTTPPDKCVNFIITLDPGAAGISFDIIDGAIPGGALFYQIGCGPPQALGTPICLSGPGPHLLTFCKPGNNANVYQITSIPAAVGGTNAVVNDGCIDTLDAIGFTESSIVWNSIAPGAPGAYNSLLSCTSGCADPIVTGSSPLPAFVDFQICGMPASMCNFATICDTVRVTFNPTLFVTIAPINPTICFGQTSTVITATGIGGTPPYSYLWNSVNPSASINVGAGNYTVMLTDASGCPPTYASVTVTSFSVAITANAGPDQVVCNQSPATTLAGVVTGASGGVWSGGAGTFSPNNATLNAIYTPTASELASGSVTLTLTTTGNGTCPAASDAVTITYQGFTGTVAVVPTPVSCFGGSNGSAAASVTGGVAPHTFSWNTVPVQTGATATGLPIGTYTVTITNGIGCTTQSTATIVQPTPLGISGVVTNVSCAGGSNGTATVTPSGGTPAYSYLWAPGGGTTPGVTGLTAGTYTVTVTDANGCTITTTSTITQPPPLAISVVKTDASCAGGSDGTATATVTGGTPAYTYSWSPVGGTGAGATGLPAGSYTVTATDNKGCVITATVTIIEPSLLTSSTSVTNETCDYLNNGTATMNAVGGTPAYTYLWSPGGMTTSTVTGLSAGTYTAVVTDAEGCTSTAFAVITQPPTLTVAMSQTNVSCFGGSNGAASAGPSGGTPGYTYLWAPGGATSSSISGLIAGTYTVTVTDNNSCTATNTVTITQPLLPVAQAGVVTNVSCFGGSNGTVSVTASGGTAPYTYLWLPGGQTTPAITGQPIGTYTLTVTDALGCVHTANYTITQPTQLAIAFTSTNVSCFAGSDGTATGTVSGGTLAYSYSWSPMGGSGSTATGLPAGTYTLTVTDGNGCVFAAPVTITEPPVLTASTTLTDETCDYLDNGTATAIPAGGTAGYTYSWSTGGSTATVTGLAAGTYTVTVTDAEGCTATATATIAQPAPLNIVFDTQQNVSCFGGSDGYVSAVPSGGTPSYAYSWSTGGTGNLITGLAAGTYTLTITDNNGCTVQNTATITQPALLTVSPSAVPAVCFGDSTGSVSASGAGGTAPYTYQWLPSGATGASLDSLTAGTYTVIVTDDHGCTGTNSVVVSQPTQIVLVTSTINSNCGTASGTASVAASGGAGGYTYSWSPSGGSAATATNLLAGPYTVYVTDADGCIADQWANVNDNTGPTINLFNVINVTCYGGNDGSASVNISGGAGPFTTTWLPYGGSGLTASGLTAGSYTVTVVDNNGCESNATTSPEITQPPAILILTSFNPVSCFGGSDGTALAAASGGTPGFTYQWMPGAINDSAATGLSAITYTVQVTDANSCIQTTTVTLTEPAAALAAVASFTPVSCFGGSDGTASSVVSGGTAPYGYSWMPGSISGSGIAGVIAGTYTVTVTDIEGCTTTASTTITQPTPLALVSGSDNAACGTASGVAYVAASGGTPGYDYLWNPGAIANDTAGAVIPGTYTVTVTDNNGCTASTPVMVNNTPGPTTTVTGVTNVSCFGGSDGTATGSVSAGTAPFAYSWTLLGGPGTVVGTAPVATGLPIGSYVLTVTDDLGCVSADTSNPITQPAPLVISMSNTTVSCFGGSDATATATVFGGTLGYSYLWMPGGATGPTATGLSAATYTVQVTDANSCVLTASVTITEPAAPLAAVASSTPVSCFGGNNGTASSVVSGGTPPYSYNWMPGSISGSGISGLIAGTYTVTATDIEGCSTTASIAVTQPTPLALVSGSDNATCGIASGLAYVSASGGTPGYSYLWNPGAVSNDTAASVLPGTYTVTVTDNNGCTASTPVVVNNTPGPVATVTTITNVSCFGGSDGTATGSVSAGTAPFVYSWTLLGGPGTVLSTATVATGLPIGSYVFTVTDDDGCVAADTSNPITQPTPVVVSVSTTDVSCFGGADGTATASVFGGTPGYTYLWMPGGTGGPTVGSLSFGTTYTVQVTDNNSCVSTTTFTVDQPTLLTATISSSSAVSCFGGANGSATVAANGGTPFYTYNWLPYGGSGATATGLSAQTYTVTATDTEGCTATATITITQPAMALTATATSTATSCFGGSDGTATASPSGGTPGYTYFWTPSGQTGITATGLAAGGYNVLVTDLNGCTTNASTTITQPTPVVVSLAVVHPSCGFSNGTITSMVSGGTPGYTYVWTPGGAVTPNISSLAPGAYNVQVTDIQGCVANASATLNNIPGPNVTIASFTNVSCFGGNNGTATAAISSGTAPYTMNWTPYGGTALTGTGFIAGTYTVTVTDSLGCVATAPVTISEPTPVGITVNSTTAVSCYGGANGAITVSGTGGTPGYTYSWPAIPSSSQTVTGLSMGTYNVFVTDLNSCTTSLSIDITQPDTLLSTVAASTNPSCFNSTNGTITVAVSGGTIPYSYVWSDSQTGSTALNLSAGSYTVTVTDNNGCTSTTSTLLTQPTQIITSAGSNDTICLGSSGTVTATASGGATPGYYYVWQPSGAINAGTFNVTPTTNTTYTVVAYGTDGCAGTPDTVSAIVYNLTAANIDALALSPLCPGQGTVVYAAVTGTTGPLSFTWNNSLGTGPGGFFIVPSAPITYVVTVTNSCGASITDSVSITFNPPPVIALSSDTTSICVPGTIQFFDNSITGNLSDPITTWLWTFGDGTTSTLEDPTHDFTSPGVYNVVLTVTTFNGCTNNNGSAPYVINAFPYPVAAFSVNSTSLDLPYDHLILDNQSVGANSYIWTFGDGGSSTLPEPDYLYSSVGIYNVQLIATNSFGCSDTADAVVMTNTDVVFPNVFTPNGSGPGGGGYNIQALDNDVFFPYTSGVTDFKFQVFNRWGELIFESTQISQGWDGYYKGQLCQQDVYVWKAYIKLNNGKVFNKSGDVTLLR